MSVYLIKQKIFKITDHFPICREDGSTAFYLNQKFNMLKYHAVLEGPNSEPICEIQEKVLAWLNTFEIKFSNGQNMVMKQKLNLFHRNFDIEGSFGKIELKGSFSDFDFSVYYEGEKIAEISRKFLTVRDQFRVETYQERFDVMVIAICLCLDKNLDKSY